MTMKQKLIILIVLGLLANLSITAQNKPNANVDKHIEEEVGYAILMMGNGMLKQSIHFLDSMNVANPDNYLIQYELGYAHLLNKDYEKSLNTYKYICDNLPDADAQAYQMLGNLYDYNGNREKAIEAYKKGIEKFPESGLNYCELGTMIAATKEDYSAAFEYYETGINVDPQYAPNYYRAAQILMLMSRQRAWGMIYAETMALMSNRVDRKEELMNIMIDIYNESITQKGDTLTVVINEGNVVELYADLIAMMYEHGHFKAAEVKKSSERYTIKELIEVRSGIIELLREIDSVYLFKYLCQVYDAGHWDAYNYWLFYEVMTEEAEAWMSENIDKMERFSEWYAQNPFELSNKNRVCRMDFMEKLSKEMSK